MSVPRRGIFITVVASLLPTSALSAQDLNIFLPIDSLEYLLEVAPFELPETLVGTRGKEIAPSALTSYSRTGQPSSRSGQRPRGVVGVRLRTSCRIRDEYNNSPRYEVAAYEIQKLFLEEPEYVVPPTVPRVVPLDWYRTLAEDIEQTFDAAASVLVVLQSFVYSVTEEDVFDLDRFASDPAYARHWANANLLTHLIWHSDSNAGNLLISNIASNPRIFSVDNGVAFGSPDSDRGTRWRYLLVDRFPASTVERLRGVTEAQLHEVLGVLAQFEVVDNELVRVESTENLRPRIGVREDDGVIQIGLTNDEIEGIWDRLEAFLFQVRRNRVSTF